MATGLMNFLMPRFAQDQLGPFIAGTKAAVCQMVLTRHSLFERFECNIHDGFGIGRHGELIAGDLQVFAALRPCRKLINEILFPCAKYPAQPEDKMSVALLRYSCSPESLLFPYSFSGFTGSLSGTGRFP